jgi:hypothetical protein
MSAIAAPLTLAEQLDAMLMGWLERVAAQRRPAPAGLRATAVLTIADTALPDVEAVCASWAMTVERPARGRIAVIEGPARVVEGFAEIASLSVRTRLRTPAPDAPR